MAVPILTTKLYMPQPRPDLVARPRLLTLMTENAQRGAKLTLVSAPPGFGKTTLVSQWLSHFRFAISDFGLDSSSKNLIQNPQSKIQNRAAWLSLDEGDNDPIRFLTYLIAALQMLDPELGKVALAGLQSPQPPTLEALLVILLNDVAGFSSPFVLVLDDYHLITAASIHQVLTFLLEHLPPRMHLVITSRADPPLPLAQLRARRQMTEVREADLRLTLDEAADFLNQIMGLSLSPEEVATLEARTEGWMAGLQLAALSMRGETDLSGFIESFSGSHRHIVDYLAEEVLHRQPEEIQTFLLQTSILERLCGPLCDAVLSRGAEAQRRRGAVDDSSLPSDSQATLEHLEAANLFLIPLDNERRWYRYHHLFADLLQARLQLTQSSPQIIELHRRAAEWCEANGLVDDAIHHAIRSDDTDRLTHLVATNASAMLAQGQVVTLEGWLDALPKDTVYARPSLSLTQAWRWLLRRRLQAIEPYLQAAEQTLADADSDQQSAGRGEIAAIRAFIASEQGQFGPAIDLARRALALLPADNLFARGSSALALGNALFSLGDTGPAATALTESVALCRAAGNALGALYSLGTLIVALTLQGRLRRAEQLLQEAFDWTAECHWQQLPPAAALYIRLGDIRREQNDLSAAEELLGQAVQLAQFGAPILSARAQAFLAQVKLTQGDTAAAAALLRQVAQISQGWETGQEVAYFAAYRTRLALRQGNLVEATAWAAQLPDWNAEETPNYFREFELVTLARVRLAQGITQPDKSHLAEAQGLLAWLRQQAEAAGRGGIVIETLTLEAVALAAQSKLSQAVTSLAQALSLAEPEGYLRLFLDEGEPLAALLAQLPSAPYRDRLLVAFSDLRLDDKHKIVNPKSKIWLSRSATASWKCCT